MNKLARRPDGYLYPLAIAGFGVTRFAGWLDERQLLLGADGPQNVLLLWFDQEGNLLATEREPVPFQKALDRFTHENGWQYRPLFVKRFHLKHERIGIFDYPPHFDGARETLECPATPDTERATIRDEIDAWNAGLYRHPSQFDEYLRALRAPDTKDECRATLAPWSSQKQYILQWRDDQEVVDDMPDPRHPLMPLDTPPSYRFPIFFDGIYDSYSGRTPDGREYLLMPERPDGVRMFYFRDGEYLGSEQVALPGERLIWDDAIAREQKAQFFKERDARRKRYLVDAQLSVERVAVKRCDALWMERTPSDFEEDLDLINHPEKHPDVSQWERYDTYQEFRNWFRYGLYWLLWGNVLQMNGNGGVDSS